MSDDSMRERVERMLANEPPRQQSPSPSQLAALDQAGLQNAKDFLQLMKDHGISGSPLTGRRAERLPLSIRKRYRSVSFVYQQTGWSILKPNYDEWGQFKAVLLTSDCQLVNYRSDENHAEYPGHLVVLPDAFDHPVSFRLLADPAKLDAIAKNAIIRHRNQQ